MLPSHICICVCLVPQSCPALCNPRDCSLLGSSVHEIVQARRLECVATSSTRGSSWRRDRSCISCMCVLHWQVDSLPLNHLGHPPRHIRTGTSFLPDSSQYILKDFVTVSQSRVWLLAAQKPIKKPSCGKGKLALFWMLATGIGVGDGGGGLLSKCWFHPRGSQRAGVFIDGGGYMRSSAANPDGHLEVGHRGSAQRHLGCFKYS